MFARSSVPKSLLLVACAALLLPTVNDASGADCATCLRTTSAAMSAINRQGVDYDEKFFTMSPAPPNIVFIVDNSEAMMDLPTPPHQATQQLVPDVDGSPAGCNVPEYEEIIHAKGFRQNDSTQAWNAIDPTFPGLFDPTKFYRYARRVASGTTGTNFGLGGGTPSGPSGALAPASGSVPKEAGGPQKAQMISYPTATTFETSATFTWTHNGFNNPKFLCAFDSEIFVPCTSMTTTTGSHVIPLLTVGTHRFTMRAYDGSTYIGFWPALPPYTWTVHERPAPVVTLTSRPPATTTDTGAAFTWTFANFVSTPNFRCSLDGGTPEPCTSGKSYAGLSAGTHVWKLDSYDGYPSPTTLPKDTQIVTWTITVDPGVFVRNFERTTMFSDNQYNSAHSSTDTACASVDSGERSNCQTCLATKGYYLPPASIPLKNAAGTVQNLDKVLFSGKFLNMYSPKYHAARKAMKDVVNGLATARFAILLYEEPSTQSNGFAEPPGGYLLQPMNPPCSSLDGPGNWASNRGSIINYIDNNLEFTARSKPAEALLSAAQYLSSSDTVFESLVGTGWAKQARRNTNKSGSAIPANTITGAANDRSICFSCQITSVILISGSKPNADNCVPKVIHDQEADCTGCNEQVGGCLDSPTCMSNCGTDGAAPCCVANKNMLDDVAQWLATTDLQTVDGDTWNMQGWQKVYTYTIAFGKDSALMRNAAKVGSGQYYNVKNYEALVSSIWAAINDIISRATAFGISSVASLQTSSADTSTLVPRFIPGRAGEPWNGMLYRFNIESEFINGCKTTVAPEAFDAKDIDKDRACTTILYKDRDGSIVEEDLATGYFFKKGTTTLAKPVWEAGRELLYTNAGYNVKNPLSLETGGTRRSPDTRVIWTVTDSNSDGVIDRTDDMVEFKTANAATLMPYMQIGTDITRDSTCMAIADSLGIANTAEVRSTWGQRCAEIVIDYYRGWNTLNPDPTTSTITRQERDWLLGDIFHSSPIIVEPPIGPESCEYFSSQCIPSLFIHAGKPADSAAATTAYKGYLSNTNGACGSVACEKRKTIALVGANGGFLHAFDAGDVASPETRDPLTGRLAYTSGSGAELWAFIPPDLLGSLKETMGRHSYFVDGTPMVRDIWVDAADPAQGDGVKAAGEFHTVAITGERSGGIHFFALDLTKDPGTSTPAKPQFLWMWPQPCDPLTTDVGQSWSNFTPKPPPIGPILLDTSTTSNTHGFEFKFRSFDDTTNAWKDNTVSAQERWVTMLSGGYDKYLVRGRGVAVVDAYTGKTYWDAFFDNTAGSIRNQLKFPIPAGVAMLDIGSGEPGTNTDDFFDGYFDGATFGDMGGNIWMTRFHAPGKLHATSGKATNWSIGRAFQTYRDDTTMAKRRSITYITSNAAQPNGFVKTMVGTGDRNVMLDMGAGTCSLDNLIACVNQGCTVEAAWPMIRSGEDAYGKGFSYSRGSTGETVTHTWGTRRCRNNGTSGGGGIDYNYWQGQCLANCAATTCTLPILPSGMTAQPAGSNACLNAVDALAEVSNCPDAANDSDLELRVDVRNCPTTTTGAVSWMRRNFVYDCDAATVGTATRVNCKLNMNQRNDNGERTYTSASDAAPYEFIAIHSYGGKNSRVFSNQSQGLTYDGNRFTECTANTCATALPAGQLLPVAYDYAAAMSAAGAKPDGAGWFLKYPATSVTNFEKTASAAGVFGECAVWNDMTPVVSTGFCASAGNQAAKMMQANIVTGKPDCMPSFNQSRFQQRNVIVPPVEPSPVLMAANGRLTYGIVTSEPGRAPQAVVTGVETDLLQSIYTIELGKSEHICRHKLGGAKCGP